MKKIYFAFLFLCILATAQTTTYNPSVQYGEEQQEIYDTFKELFVKRVESESYQKWRQASNIFLEKTNQPLKTLMTEHTTFLEWIKNNLSSTAFESYEEAENDWNTLTEAYILDKKENSEYYTLTEKLYKEEWGYRLIADAMSDVICSNSEIFKRTKKQ